MSLIESQIVGLGKISDQPGFIEETKWLIEDFENMGNQTVLPSKKEIEKLTKVLSNISDNLRSNIKLFHAERMYLKKKENESWESLKEGSDYCPIPLEMNSDHDLVVQMQLAIEKLVGTMPQKKSFKRKLIMTRALQIFEKYQIKPTKYTEGDFADYFTIVFDILGLDHDPHHAARDALK